MQNMINFIFVTLNGALGMFFSGLFILAAIFYTLSVIYRAIKGKKEKQVTEKKSKRRTKVKPSSQERTASDREKSTKMYRSLEAVIGLFVIDAILSLYIYVYVFLKTPIWPRWALFILTLIILVIFLIYKFDNRRILYSSLGHLGVIFLGWVLLGQWIGVLCFSVPLILAYYIILYQFAMVIIPANNPESKLVLSNENNEKRQRFAAFFWYTWGLQHPMLVVDDGLGRDISSRITGSRSWQFSLPGIMLIHPHQVASLTTGTELARIAGPAVIFTKRFERPWEIIDLRQQVRTSSIDAVTLDGIPFTAKLYMVFQVDATFPNFSEGGFPYSTQSIHRLLHQLGTVYTDVDDKHVIHWDERVVEQVKQAARQVLSKRTLNDLWQPLDNNDDNSAFEEIEEKIRLALQQHLAEKGIKVMTSLMLNIDFDDIKRKADITAQQLKTWQSTWALQASQALAEGQAEAERLQKEAHAYAQSVLLKSLAEGIKQATPQMSRYVIAVKFVSAFQELLRKQPEVAANLGSEITPPFGNAKKPSGSP